MESNAARGSPSRRFLACCAALTAKTAELPGSGSKALGSCAGI